MKKRRGGGVGNFLCDKKKGDKSEIQNAEIAGKAKSDQKKMQLTFLPKTKSPSRLNMYHTKKSGV